MTSAVSQRIDGPGAVALGRDVGRLWWLWLVTGIAWVVASLVVLQFNHASVTTVSIIVGCMFIAAGVQQLTLAAMTDHLRWLWIVFGVLFIVCGIVAFIRPGKTFAGLADSLGFLFLVVGVWWTIEALIERERASLWWLGLLSGILMIVAAFWTSGQFFFQRVYTLLVIAGVWALMHGVLDICRAFQIRRLKDA